MTHDLAAIKSGADESISSSLLEQYRYQRNGESSKEPIWVRYLPASNENVEKGEGSSSSSRLRAESDARDTDGRLEVGGFDTRLSYALTQALAYRLGKKRMLTHLVGLAGEILEELGVVNGARDIMEQTATDSAGSPGIDSDRGRRGQHVAFPGVSIDGKEGENGVKPTAALVKVSNDKTSIDDGSQSSKKTNSGSSNVDTASPTNTGQLDRVDGAEDTEDSDDIDCTDEGKSSKAGNNVRLEDPSDMGTQGLRGNDSDSTGDAGAFWFK